MQSPIAVIFLGPPGSGKGTQAKRLAQEYHFPEISTGDLFREHIEEQTPIGMKAKSFMQRGELVPDEIVLGMLFERLERPDCQQGFVLDGVPRTINQAEVLANHQSLKAKTVVLCLEVPDEVIIKRSGGRLVCRQCCSIYNRNISPPVHEKICDKCGGEVYRREDDNPEVVSKRLKVYHALTQPLIAHYDHKGLLTAFDGNQHPDVVHAEIKQYLDNFLN